MRLALVHMRHAGTGGTERYLNQVARLAAERGHDVTIMCRSHEEPPHPTVKFEVLHPFAIGGAWRMLSFARAVETHVAQSSYDLVFGLGKTWTHDVIRLGGGCHQTYLERAHASTLTKFEQLIGKGKLKHRFALDIERRALGSGAYRRVITNSEMVKQDVMQRHGVPAESIDVVYNGVDLERYRPDRRESEGRLLRGSLGLAPDDFVVLFLGTGYGRKGLAEVIDGFRPAKERGAQLLVCGYDSSRAEFESRASAAGLDGHVQFLGGRRDTEAVYAMADLYVLPTRYDPFANTTLEALASGLPTITTKSNGGSELITSGVDGSVLGEKPNADEIEAAILEWMEPERAKEARTAARRLAECHPATRTAEDSLAVLTAVLEQAR